jgi:hypothetical protein
MHTFECFIDDHHYVAPTFEFFIAGLQVFAAGYAAGFTDIAGESVYAPSIVSEYLLGSDG